MSTNLLPRPKSHTEAHDVFLRAMGDPRTLNKYLAGALACMALATLSLVVLDFRIAAHQNDRIVVRIDDIGRAQAMGISSLSYRAQPQEIRYFLQSFVSNYSGRNRLTVERDIGLAFHFLGASMAQAVRADEQEHKTISKFALSGDDEIDILVKNIVLDDLSKEPYSAQVDLEKIYKSTTGRETRREAYIDSITFTIADKVDNAEVPFNPLGLTILSLRENQAFQTTKKE